MTRTLDDLRGALHEEADAAAYPDVDALVAGARRHVVATRRRRLAVLGAVTAAVMVVGGVAMTRPTHQALPQPAGTGASGTATSPAASPTASLSASQSAADARSFDIDPAVAAAPIGVRVRRADPRLLPLGSVQASTPEGLWLVSDPDQFSADISAYPGLAEYGELLLLTPDRSRILSAYPFRGVPPQWLLVTQEAIYCGRQGDGELANSMVCRVDRSTGALTVVVFPSPDDFATDAPPVLGGLSAPQALAGRPGSWRLAGSLESADLQHVPRLIAGSLLFARDPNQAGGGKSLRMDPVTLR